MSTNVTQNSNAFGPKTSKGRMTGGFATMIIGILLGLAALTLFILSLTVISDANVTTWRRVALPMGAGSIAIILTGITVALPTTTVMRVLGVVGTVLCLAATLFLAIHYPNDFNVKDKPNFDPATQTDYLPLDVGLYAAGLAALLASIFTSIIGYYLSRVQGPAAASEEEEDEFGAGYEIPDWVIERDIEQAMKRHSVSWGSGVPEDKAGMVVNIPDSLGSNIKVGGLGKARVVQLDADQVDFSVGKLSGVRPQKKAALPTEWTDQSVAALVQFRKQKQADPKAYKPKLTGWQKFKAFFTGRKDAPEADRAAGPIALGMTAKARPAGTPSRANGATGATPRKGKTIVIEDEK